MMRIVLVASLVLVLSACGASEDGEGVGGVTASEARALNDAAEMLDSRPGAPGEIDANLTAPR
jgi:hypothetical protein